MLSFSQRSYHFLQSGLLTKACEKLYLQPKSANNNRKGYPYSPQANTLLASLGLWPRDFLILCPSLFLKAESLQGKVTYDLRYVGRYLPLLSRGTPASLCTFQPPTSTFHLPSIFHVPFSTLVLSFLNIWILHPSSPQWWQQVFEKPEPLITHPLPTLLSHERSSSTQAEAEAPSQQLCRLLSLRSSPSLISNPSTKTGRNPVQCLPGNSQ